MRPVSRSEILDYVTYTERRPQIAPEIQGIKAARRVHVGGHLTFLFENTDTIRYQVQEMVRTEQIVKEDDIQHELDTYNELLGASGELGCSLLIGIPTPEERAVLLKEGRHLTDHLYVKVSDGTKIYATYDQRQVGDERLSSVQYLKFNTEGRVPVALGVDFPSYNAETDLDEKQIAALTEDPNSD